MKPVKTEKMCAICGKAVKNDDQQDHLDSQHLGPHYFWLDARPYRTMKPSMRGDELIRLCDAKIPPMGRLVESRDGLEIDYLLNNSVDLTKAPHFRIIYPATMSPRHYD